MVNQLSTTIKLLWLQTTGYYSYMQVMNSVHVAIYVYRIRGLFGGDINFGGLANFYWFAKFKSRYFNSHTRNELIYLLFRQI